MSDAVRAYETEEARCPQCGTTHPAFGIGGRDFAELVRRSRAYPDLEQRLEAALALLRELLADGDLMDWNGKELVESSRQKRIRIFLAAQEKPR